MNDFDYLVLYAICAFYDYDDFYCHFSLLNLSLCGVGQPTLSATIKKLCLIGMLLNCTVNGFYNRYIVNCYFPCPDFVFNDKLPIRIKQFLCRCIRYKSLLCNKMTSREVHKLLYWNNSYKKTANNMSVLKSCLGKSLFEYLLDYSYIEASPFDGRYPLIKKDSGYLIDSESEKRKRNLEKSLSKLYICVKSKESLEERILRQGIGHYLMKKVSRRINNDLERFSDSDVDELFLNELYLKLNCCDYYTGLRFDCLQQISVDRIDSSRPYMKNNVVLTTAAINIMKHTQNISDFIEKCHLISNHFKNDVLEGIFLKPINTEFAYLPIFSYSINVIKIFLLCYILSLTNNKVSISQIVLLSMLYGFRIPKNSIDESLSLLINCGLLDSNYLVLNMCSLDNFSCNNYQLLFGLCKNDFKIYLLYWIFNLQEEIGLFNHFLKKMRININSLVIYRSLSRLVNLGLLFKSSRGNYAIL